MGELEGKLRRQRTIEFDERREQICRCLKTEVKPSPYREAGPIPGNVERAVTW